MKKGKKRNGAAGRKSKAEAPAVSLVTAKEWGGEEGKEKKAGGERPLCHMRQTLVALTGEVAGEKASILLL